MAGGAGSSVVAVGEGADATSWRGDGAARHRSRRLRGRRSSCGSRPETEERTRGSQPMTTVYQLAGVGMLVNMFETSLIFENF